MTNAEGIEEVKHVVKEKKKDELCCKESCLRIFPLEKL